VQVDVVGVGSATPVTIHTASGPMIDDETGEVVKTALNEDLASSIAKSGKGIYINASNRDALSELQRQLDTLKKSAMESSLYSSHDELFSIFLWFALALIIVDMMLLDRKIGWLDKFTFFKKDNKK
jgi:Ca-activated chloride channel family protein